MDTYGIIERGPNQDHRYQRNYVNRRTVEPSRHQLDKGRKHILNNRIENIPSRGFQEEMFSFGPQEGIEGPNLNPSQYI